MTYLCASGRVLYACGYGLNGKPAWQEDASGKRTEYRYNALDLLEEVTDNGKRVAEYAYVPGGLLSSLESGELRTSYQYDADRTLPGLHVELAGGGAFPGYVDPSGHWCETKQDIYNKLMAEARSRGEVKDGVRKLDLMAEAANITNGKKVATNLVIYQEGSSERNSQPGIEKIKQNKQEMVKRGSRRIGQEIILRMLENI